MTQTVEQRRTIEARLDRLKKRLDRDTEHASPALVAVLKGVLDLLSDVLLEDDHG